MYNLKLSKRSNNLYITWLDARDARKNLLDGKVLCFEENNKKIVLSQDGVLTVDGFDTVPTIFVDCCGFDSQESDQSDRGIIRNFVKKIVVGDGTKHVGYKALSGYKNAEEILLPDSVESIYESFAYCPALKKINFPKNLVEIKGSPFMASLENADTIVLPDHLTNIGKLFAWSRVKSVVLPKNLKKLDAEAFYNADNLENVTLNEGLETIERDCFKNCKSLEKILLPASIKQIEKNAFCNTNISIVEKQNDVKLCKNMFLHSPFASEFFDEIEQEIFDKNKHVQPVFDQKTISALSGKSILQQAKLLHFAKNEVTAKYSYGKVDSKNEFCTFVPLYQVSQATKIIVKDGIIAGAVIDDKTFVVGKWKNVYYASDDDGTGGTSIQVDATLMLK